MKRQNEEAVAAVRAALENSEPAARAELLEAAVRAIYDWSKFQAPGGEGPDGRGGLERSSLARIHDEAVRHLDAFEVPRRA